MNNPIDNDAMTRNELLFTLTDTSAYSNEEAVPISEQDGGMEAYHAFDDGSLAAIPYAMAAYMSHQQYQLV